MNAKQLALMGDSIFDNAAYVPGELPVIGQLQQALPLNWQASLLAVDGHTTTQVLQQFQRLPAEVDAIVISCGGNDALQGCHILSEPVSSVSEALFLLARQLDEFRSHYRQVLQTAKTRCRSVSVCTIYNAIPGLGADSRTALALYNEAILQEAAIARIDVIDLRVLCTEMSDFSVISPIEPSGAGGRKIAGAIVAHLLRRMNQINQARAATSEIPVIRHPAEILSHPDKPQCPDYQIDLGAIGWRKREPFRVQLLGKRLANLQQDAMQGARLYELLSLSSPGDLWHYIDVVGLELPERVAKLEMEKRREVFRWHREGEPLPSLSLAQFDALFYWCEDDTSDEDSAWLGKIERGALNTYLDSLFTLTRLAQEKARNLDLIARHEANLIDKIQHPCDRLPPERWKKMMYCAPDEPQRLATGFLEELQRLIADESIGSVCGRGMNYRVLRLLCTEQLARAQHQQQHPRKAFPINTLCDPIFDVTPWGASVMWFYEGMGSGDLYFELPGGWGGCSAKELWEKSGKSTRILLLPEDAGEINGFDRELGYGWVRYKRARGSQVSP